MVHGLVGEGFDLGSKRAAAANLTPTELAEFADGLNSLISIDFPGQWVEWIGENCPTEKGNQVIAYRIRQWTIKDYQAAGKRLRSAQASPAKKIAIRSYAEMISPDEPETAAQWAMTLPPGQQRNDTLKQGHSNWPQGDIADKAAATAFEKKHGIPNSPSE